MKKILKDSLILFIITLFGGLCLGVVYEVTKEPIAVQAEKAKNAAYQTVFTSKEGKTLASDFVDIDKSGLPSDEFKQILTAAGFESDTISDVVCALDDSGKPLGLVLTVVSKEGYGDEIKFTVGIMKDGTVNGISVLSIKETAGLGMKADTAEFKDQFAYKKVSQFKYTKKGAVAENEIDALSGATITTNAMTNGVNSAITAFRYVYDNKLKTTGGVVIE